MVTLNVSVKISEIPNVTSYETVSSSRRFTTSSWDNFSPVVRTIGREKKLERYVERYLKSIESLKPVVVGFTYGLKRSGTLAIENNPCIVTKPDYPQSEQTR